MQQSPFKFLDSYTLSDRDIFFGREAEIEEVYSRLFYSKLLMIYGPSGSGKTSLLQCGVANRFGENNWKPIFIRRKQNINNTIHSELEKQSITKLKSEKTVSEKLYSLYLDYLTPVYLIFDQFEELFIFGSVEEKQEFVNTLKEILSHEEINTQIILSIREEYLANLSEFEDELPQLFENRIRIEKMKKAQALEAIEGPCKVAGVKLEESVSEKVLERLSTKSGYIELTWLQVLMDNLYKKANERNPNQLKIENSDVEQLGKMGDVLGNFLEDQLKAMPEGEKGEALLKAMITSDGTKKQLTPEEIETALQSLGHQLTKEEIQNILQHLVNVRILSDKDESGRYELKHDSLAAKIYEKLTLAEKELMEVRQFVEYAYQNYQSRSKYLSEDDLKYIAPYEGKLYLPKSQERFVSESFRILEQKKRRKRNLIYLTSVLVILALAITGIFTYQAQKKAEEQAIIEKSKKLGNKAMLYVEKNPTLAYLIAEEAYTIYPSFEAERAILNAYKNAPFYNKIEGNHFIISKSEKYILATSSLDNNIRIYDFLGNLIALYKGHNGPIQSNSLKFSDSENYIMSESIIDSTIRVWDITGNEIFKINKGGYKFFGFLPNDNIYILSKEDYQSFNILGDKLSYEEFEKPVLKIIVDSIHAAILTSDTVVEIKTLYNFKTIAKRTKFANIGLKFTYLICNTRKKIVIINTNSSICYLWNWATDKLFSLDIKGEINRHFNVKKNYLIVTYYEENMRPGSLKIYDIRTGKVILDFAMTDHNQNHFLRFYDLRLIDSESYIIPGIDKTFLFDIYGKELYAYDGEVVDINLQSKLLLAESYSSNYSLKTVNIFSFKGNKYLSIDLDNILFSRFIDKDKIAIGCKDNTIYIYNIKGDLLYTLKSIPTNSIQQWEEFLYFINDRNLLIKCKNGLYSFILDKLKIKREHCTEYEPDYLKLANKNQFFELSSNPSRLNLYNTKSQPLSNSDSVYSNLDLIKFAPDNKYVAIQNVEIYQNFDSVAFKIRVFTLPDFKLVYYEKHFDQIYYEGKLFGIEYLNSIDTSCVLYSKGTIKYLDKQFKIIDKWTINNISYCGFDNYYNNWLDMKNGHLIGYCNSDSSLKMYDYVNKDSIILNKQSTKNYYGVKLMFIKNGKQLLYYEQAKNKLYVLNLNLDTLDIIKPLGKSIKRIYNFDELLFISSIEAEFVFYENNTFYKNEIPQSYFQIYDLKNRKIINEYMKPDVIELIFDYSNKSNLVAFIDKTNFNRRHPISSYIDIQNIKGQSLLSLETSAASNFSEDGKFIVYYDERYKKLTTFPLDASEVINRIRELKEFGNISNLELEDIGNNQITNSQENTSIVIDSNSFKIMSLSKIVKTKEEFDKKLLMYSIHQDWENYYELARNNIKKYYWNDYDELAEISEIMLAHTESNSELNEIVLWAHQSVSLKNYIYNTMLLSKIYFKLDKENEALKIAENILSSKILSLDYNYLYNYYGPENFKKVIDVLFESTHLNSNDMNNIAWFFYENFSEKEILASALILIKKSVQLKRGAANLDTYAALLYKLEKYVEALPIAKEAYNLAIEEGLNTSEYQKRLENIKNKLNRNK